MGRRVQKFKLLVDNKSAIELCKNPVFHERSKHIDTRFHYIRDCVSNGQVDVEHVRTDNQLADILTKALSRSGSWSCHRSWASLRYNRIRGVIC